MMKYFTVATSKKTYVDSHTIVLHTWCEISTIFAFENAPAAHTSRKRSKEKQREKQENEVIAAICFLRRRVSKPAKCTINEPERTRITLSVS